jgi:hypothetical protein
MSDEKMPEKKSQFRSMRSSLSSSEKQFISRALKYFNIRSIRVEWSGSEAKHPDIWVNRDTVPPTITVTQEWACQQYPERMKRVVHELLHIKGFEHSRKLGYSTYPEKDVFSVKVYNDIVSGTRRFQSAKFVR